MELILEIGIHAHAANHHARANLAAEINEQGVEDVHLHIRKPRLLHVLSDHVDAVLRIKERARLHARRGHRHDETII